MPRNQSPFDRTFRSVWDGAKWGLQTALGASLYVAVMLVFATVVYSIRWPGVSWAEVWAAWRKLAMWVPASYFAAFALAGALLAVVDKVGATPLRYTLKAFLSGTAIYGVVGAVMKLGGLFDDPQPGWTFVGAMSLGLGMIWGILGAAHGLVRSVRSRHGAKGERTKGGSRTGA